MNTKTKEMLAIVAMQEQVIGLTVKVTLIENMLLRKKILDEEEYGQELKKATELVAETLGKMAKKLNDELEDLKKESSTKDITSTSQAVDDKVESSETTLKDKGDTQ